MPNAKTHAHIAPRNSFASRSAVAAGLAILLLTPVSAAAYIVIPGVPTSAVAVVNVSTPAALRAAITNATGPTEIRLAAGNYGDMTINNSNHDFDIVIRSANGSNRASFERLSMWKSSRIRMEKINFQLDMRPGDWDTTAGVWLLLTNNISFSRCNFLGSQNGNMNDDMNMFRAIDSDQVLLFNNYFSESRLAIAFRGVNKSSIFANRIRDVREGVNLDGVELIKVERNYISHVVPNEAAGDHADALQVFRGPSAKISKDILFRSNALILDHGKAGGLHVSNLSHFAKHQKIRFLHNVIYGRMRQGVWIENTIANTIDRNTVIAAPNFALEPAIFLRDTSYNTVRSNVASMLLFTNETVTESNNLDLWDTVRPTGPTAQSQTTGNVEVSDPPISAFKIKPGSIAAGMVAGANLSTGVGGFTGTDAAIEAQFQTVLAEVRGL